MCRITKKEYPKVVVGQSGGGKTLAQMKEIIRLVEKLDGGDIINKPTAEYYNEQLKKLSDNSIGVRIWNDWNNKLRCVVVYSNSTIKELMEW